MTREQIAEAIYQAMVWAAQQPPPPNGAAYPSWQNGNSDAETKARGTATAILDAMPAPVWREYGEGPDEGTEMLVKSEALIDEDFNEQGVAVGTVGSWGATCAVWYDCQDCYGTRQLEPGSFLVAPLLSQPPTPHPEQPEPIREAVGVILSNGFTDQTNNKIATAMSLVLRADIDPSAWNTDCEMLNAFAAGLRALEEGA